MILIAWVNVNEEGGALSTIPVFASVQDGKVVYLLIERY